MTARRRAPLPALLLLCLLPAASGATSNFPGALRAELGLRTPPDCSLCHVGRQQVGTVNTPFGVSMRSRGLVFYDEASLRRALAALRAEGTDSDGDGVPDLDELVAGGDPNVASGAGGGGGGGEDLPPGPPVYGCSSAGGASPTGLLLLVMLGWLARVASLALRPARARTAPGCAGPAPSAKNRGPALPRGSWPGLRGDGGGGAPLPRVATRASRSRWRPG